MTAAALPTSLTSLAARLTEPQDRETYAGLVSYFNAIPRNDELFRLVELLGLLSLLGQRIPDALLELLAELRAQTKAAGDYHAQVNERLARLPQEIAAGVDVSAIAQAMSESLRQQLSGSGLQDTALLLNASAKDMKALSSQISATLKPVAQQYQDISMTIAAELQKLALASVQLRNQNSELMTRERSNSWLWQGLLALVLWLVGALGGIAIEKRQTSDTLSDINAQVERIQASLIPRTTESRAKSQARFAPDELKNRTQPSSRTGNTHD